MPSKITLFIFLLFANFCPSKADNLHDEKITDIKNLIAISGGTEVAPQYAEMVSRAVFMTLKSTRPEIPDRVLELMQQGVGEFFSDKLASPGGLVDLIVPVYDEHFSHDEIRDLLAFYKSPTGRKFAKELPVLTKETMNIGQLWGESLKTELEAKIISVLSREGIIPAE